MREVDGFKVAAQQAVLQLEALCKQFAVHYALVRRLQACQDFGLQGDLLIQLHQTVGFAVHGFLLQRFGRVMDALQHCAQCVEVFRFAAVHSLMTKASLSETLVREPLVAIRDISATMVARFCASYRRTHHRHS